MSNYWVLPVVSVAIVALTGCAGQRDTATVAGCAPDAKPANLITP